MRTSELVKLVFHGRHFGLRTTVIAQQLTSIAKPYCMNKSKVITFYNSRKYDRKDIFENDLSVNESEEQKILDMLKNNKFARLEILTIYPHTNKVIASEC